jgi:uncharacterized damage-inducible protein DinB
MHPYLAAVCSRLDAARAGLRAAVEAIPTHARGVRPAPDRWSANEVLEHLSLVEGLFTGRIAAAIAAARQEGLGAEQATERAPLPEHLETIVADRINRRTAPEPAHPRGGLDATAAWDAVEKARARLVDALRSVDGLALSQVTPSHPAFGALTIYQFVELIAAHEARHTAQIREMVPRAVES